MTEKPNLILTGGRVFCGLHEGFAEAIAMASGQVIATGTAKAIAELAGPETRIVDLAGRLAIPGLNDAHMHLLPYGLNMKHINLRPESGASSMAGLPLTISPKAVSPRWETLTPGP